MDKLPAMRNLSGLGEYSVRGGFSPVSGWVLTQPGDFRDFVEDGLRENTDVHFSFDSMDEIGRFMRGVGEYSDRNSFFYSSRDGELQSEEGFFGEMYCDKCVEDFRDELINADNPVEADLNPDQKIHVYFSEEQDDSYRPGYDKFVREVSFSCLDHSEVSLELRETWYEEQ